MWDLRSKPDGNVDVPVGWSRVCHGTDVAKVCVDAQTAQRERERQKVARRGRIKATPELPLDAARNTYSFSGGGILGFPGDAV